MGEPYGTNFGSRSVSTSHSTAGLLERCGRGRELRERSPPESRTFWAARKHCLVRGHLFRWSILRQESRRLGTGMARGSFLFNFSKDPEADCVAELCGQLCNQLHTDLSE